MRRILVIENDIDTLDLLNFFLNDLGYEVLATQRRIPIEKIISDNPDLILIDYFLNDGYGKNICLEIKANKLTRHIPVVIMSTSFDIEKYAIESCADAFIAKPFDIMELEDLVRATAA